MNYINLFFIISLAGFQLAISAPTEQRNDFFANIDYNQAVGHMKEFMMYLPVLMTTVKETMTGFPKITEGLNSIQAKRYGRHTDGRCRCKQVNVDTKNDESGYR